MSKVQTHAGPKGLESKPPHEGQPERNENSDLQTLGLSGCICRNLSVPVILGNQRLNTGRKQEMGDGRGKGTGLQGKKRAVQLTTERPAIPE